MKLFSKLFLLLAAVGVCVSAIYAEDEAPQAAPVKVRHGANGEAILTLDEATQQRLGLGITNPAATEWQPEIKAYGRVLDVTPLMDLLVEFRKAQIAFDNSHQELERAKQLKKDDNLSERAFQDTEAAYTLNLAAMGAVAIKIQTGWGKKISEMLGPPVVAPGTERKPDKFLQSLPDSVILIRADLPAGERLQTWSQAARVVSLTKNAGPLPAVVFDELPVIDPQTQQQGILLAAEQSRTNRLMQGEAVTAYIKIPVAEPVTGVVVPAAAVLRHDGKGWIYVQTGPTDFMRRELPLDRALDGGFFCSGLTATNRVVVTGAQTMLSAELSGGNFNSGSRD